MFFLLGCSSDNSPWGLTESAESEKHAHRRPSPLPLIFCFPPHILFHPHTYNVGGPKGLRHHLVPACCRATQRGQETARTPSKEQSPSQLTPRLLPSSGAHMVCPSSGEVLSSAEQEPSQVWLGDEEAAKEPSSEMSHGPRLPRKCWATWRKQGRLLLGLCEQVSMALQQILCPDTCPTPGTPSHETTDSPSPPRLQRTLGPSLSSSAFKALPPLASILLLLHPGLIITPTSTCSSLGENAF